MPQLFVSTGATTFDRDYAQYPWTLGWQPDYEAEGSIYGKYIAKNLPSAKLGILYQDDDYGNDYLRGLKSGLTASTRRRSSTPRATRSAARRLRHRWRS